MTPRVTGACGTLIRRDPCSPVVVKKSRVLKESNAEADVPYAQTRLARQASRARPRVTILLALGVFGFLFEAALTQSVAWALAAVALALLAWGTRAGKLSAMIGATFVAVVALLVPVVIALVLKPAQADVVTLAFVAVWGLAMLPDTVTLLRDQELQHAFGLWARRE